MRTCIIAFAIAVALPPGNGWAQRTVAVTPTAVPAVSFQNVSQWDKQLIETSVVVRGTETPQVITINDIAGSSIRIMVPNPATGAAHVGDTLTVMGFVRRFNAGAFEREYPWFRQNGYPGLNGGDWVIVATSVRTPQGTELVPPGVISESTASGKKSGGER